MFCHCRQRLGAAPRLERGFLKCHAGDSSPKMNVGVISLAQALKALNEI